MDTSETYIKMCEKAEEIQNYWINPANDYYLPPVEFVGCCVYIPKGSITKYIQLEKGKHRILQEFNESRGQVGWVTNSNGYSHSMVGFDIWKALCVFVPSCSLWIEHKSLIWLPRQDQLQEMLDFLDNVPYKKLIALYRWMCQTGLPMEGSMEQLWLAFVMKEKFNKVWTGENWISK